MNFINKIFSFRVLIAFLVVLNCTPAHSQDAFDISQALNTALPLSLAFQNERGEPLNLAKPHTLTLVTLNYFRCKTACEVQFATLHNLLPHLPPKNVNIVSISFDPSDTPHDAQKVHQTWAQRDNPHHIPWHFYVGAQKEISKLTSTLHFFYEKDKESGEYAHAAALFFVDSQSRVCRYLYGVTYTAADIRHALWDCSHEKQFKPSWKERLSFWFTRYDEKRGKYLPRFGGDS